MSRELFLRLARGGLGQLTVPEITALLPYLDRFVPGGAA
jgi:hypothetical protein